MAIFRSPAGRPMGRFRKELCRAGTVALIAVQQQQLRRPWVPFVLAAAILVVVSVAIFRLPDTFVSQLQNNGRLSGSQAGWLFRLLAAAATGQALFGGFVVLSHERIARARQNDAKIAHMPRARLVAMTARSGAGMMLLTLVYGLASFALTGQRGGFWYFIVLAVAQDAWYYRRVGELSKWIGFQPESQPPRARNVWKREPPDYCPPIARGLQRPESEAKGKAGGKARTHS